MLLIRSIQIYSNFISIFWLFSVIHPCIHSFAIPMILIRFFCILFYLLLLELAFHSSIPVTEGMLIIIWHSIILFSVPKATNTWGGTFILIPFGTRFTNTFLHIMPRVEIRATYEIIVSHVPEQDICILNCAIPTSPPQCLTVTEGIIK